MASGGGGGAPAPAAPVRQIKFVVSLNLTPMFFRKKKRMKKKVLDQPHNRYLKYG